MVHSMLPLGTDVGLGALLLGDIPWNPKMGVLPPVGARTEEVDEGD